MNGLSQFHRFSYSSSVRIGNVPQDFDVCDRHKENDEYSPIWVIFLEPFFPCETMWIFAAFMIKNFQEQMFFRQIFEDWALLKFRYKVTETLLILYECSFWKISENFVTKSLLTKQFVEIA